RVPLENTSPPTDPAAFVTQITMDPASRLFHLRQGNHRIEYYTMDFCGLCHMVAFNDVALKDIFRQGLNKHVRSQLPGGKIHWTLEQYINFTLFLAGSPFTVGVANEQPCNPSFPTTPKPAHVMSTKPKPAQVMSGIIQVASEPSHAMPAAPGPAHAMAALPESAPVMAALPKPFHKMAATPKPHHSKIISSESHLI
ncbi:hypothetical protein M9458_017942, partial [Cirrhinus mrigala]